MQPDAVHNRHWGELRRVSRSLLRLSKPDARQPGDRDERIVRHLGDDRRLHRCQRLRVQSIRVHEGRARSGADRGLPEAGHHPHDRPRRPVVREQPGALGDTLAEEDRQRAAHLRGARARLALLGEGDTTLHRRPRLSLEYDTMDNDKNTPNDGGAAKKKGTSAKKTMSRARPTPPSPNLAISSLPVVAN